ncbi:hypothetical protein KY345_04925 [Candidatus Woesearchaeota archaeon]|nr:hypothetical protein [Candidatus Woesearchaeota archaeon]
MEKDHSGEEPEEKPKDDPKADSRSTLIFFIILGVIVMLFAAVFIARAFIKPKTYTMDEMIARTLQGEEDPETNYMYNGFVFVKVGNLWYTKWQLENYVLNIPLHYGPLELEDVKAEGQLDERFNSDHYYVTFDPYGEDFSHVALAAGELGRNLVEGLGIRISGACLNNHTVCKDKPIITCSNTNESVIFFKESDEAKIVMDGNCLILQGKDMELLKVTDRVILQMYGIMK